MNQGEFGHYILACLPNIPMSDLTYHSFQSMSYFFQITWLKGNIYIYVHLFILGLVYFFSVP